jgi:predicted acyltransferase (DUF342 family)
VSLNNRLTVSGDVYLANRTFILGDISANSRLFINADVSLNSNLFVFNDVSLNNRLTVSGDVYMANRTFILGDISANSRLFINADVSLNRNLFVLNDVSFNNRLTVGGDVYLANRTFILGDISAISRLFINADVSLNSNLFVFNDVSLNNRMTVSGDVYLANRTFIFGDISANSRLFVLSDVSLNRNLFVLNDVALNNRLTISGDVYLANRMFIKGDVSANSRLFVLSDVSMNARLGVAGDVSLNNRLFVYGDVSLNGRLNIAGDVSINSRLFVNADVSMKSRLFVSSDSSFSSRLFINSDISANSRLFVASDVSINGKLAVRRQGVINEVANAISSIFSVVNYTASASNTAYFANNGANTNPIIIMDTSGAASTATYIQFSNNNVNVGATGKITGTSTTISYSTASDYRLKGNVQDMYYDSAIQTVTQLRPVTFVFKSDPNNPTDGFIAHELQSVVPQAVTGYKDEVDSNGNPVYQNVDTGFIIPYLTKTTQYLISEANYATTNITHLQDQLYEMQPPNSKDFTITGNLVTNSRLTSLGDFYAKSDIIISNPITINYQPTAINNAIGNQIGAQQRGQYIRFSKISPVNSCSVYSINLSPGVWLVESNICYQTDGPMRNTESVSLSIEEGAINSLVLISTPIVTNKIFTRFQRISSTFSLTQQQTIYTVFQANDYDGTATTITSLNNGNIIATRIA